MTKWCPQCQKDRPVEAFNKNQARSDGLASMCRECQHRRYREDSEHQRALARQRGARRTYRQSLRVKAIMRYGGRCACCFDDEVAFLVLDHVSGGGTAKRGVDKHNETRRAAIGPFDPAEFQVLCANCNMAKERKEGCPHQSSA
jgi:hypothetical protein